MTYEEALEYTEKSIAICEGSNVFSTNLDYWKKVKEAIEKQISKKPIECYQLDKGYLYDEDGVLVCPNYVKPIINVWSKREYKPRYCHYCGQALDWSKENEI